MATDNDALTIELRGKITDFQRAMRQAESRVASLEKSVARDMRRVQQSSSTAARKIEQDFTSSSRRVIAQAQTMRAGVTGALGGLGGLGATLLGGVSLTAGVTAVAQANMRYEAIDRTLKTVFGSAQAAGEEMAFLRAEADRLGLGLMEAASAYASLSAAAQGTNIQGKVARDTFTAVSQAMAILGRSSYETEGALRAIEQMISKGKISAEELRGQLGERLPGAFRLAAEAIGVTTMELDKMLSAGEVFADADFFTRFAARLRQAYPAERIEGLRADVNRLGTAWNDFLVTVGNTGATSAMATALGNLADVVNALNNGVITARDGVQRLTSALQDMANSVGNAGIWERLNVLLADNGLMNFDGITMLSDELAAAEQEAESLETRTQALVRENEELRGRVELVKEMIENARAAGDEMSIRHLLEQWQELNGLLDQNLNRLEMIASINQANPFPIYGPQMLPGFQGYDSARALLESRRTDGNEDISRLTDAAAAGAAAVLRMPQFAGLTIDSAYRANASLPGSRHTFGGRGDGTQSDAVDFRGVTPENVGALVAALRQAGFRGFGYYNNGMLHADMGPPRAWGPNRSASSLGQTPAAFRNAVAFGPSPATALTPEAGAALSQQLWQDDLARQDRENAAAAREARGSSRRRATPDEDAQARERQAEAIARVNEYLREQLELAGIEQELLGQGVLTREQVAAALDQEQLVRQKLNELEAAGVVVTEEMEAALRQKIATLFELQAANEATAASQQRLVDQTQALQGAFEAVGQPILDTFMGIISGSEDASEALKKLALQLANMVLQGALFGSGPLGSILGGGLFGGLFGGARAAGGPVTGGTPYLVGERGPELFVPGATGQIVNATATRAMMNRAATPVSPAGVHGRGEAIRVELVSRFDADGGFSSAVERASRPVAIREARTAASEVASRVPEMTDARMDQRENRRTRPLRPALNVAG